jgi:HrpA-like RNA helicase
MSKEWNCVCKDCNKPFAYSDTKYESGRVRGWSRPERCDSCRAQHAREINSIGQAYYKVRALRPILDPKRLTSDLGRFKREDRPHDARETHPAPLDEKKFGIKNDRLIEMFDFFVQDPGLQVVVVVGPTGSGKSTYLPYRLVELPENYKDPEGNVRDVYWTVPIETDVDLAAAASAIKHTPLSKGLRRHYTTQPSDPRASMRKVSEIDQKMFYRYGQIVVTQPRIQATRNIPDYIAKAMMGCQLGAGFDVGFRHSGSPNSDWNTKLAFVTDGTLITWIAKGELDKINTVMIDEAHERSLNIDIIIGMLTQLLPRYPRLKLIIASATISADKFINHFNKHLPTRRDAAGNVFPNCRLMEFEGKSFKVSPHFRRDDEPPLDYYRENLPPDSEGNPQWEGRHRTPKEIHEQVADKAMEILTAMYDTSPNGGYLTDNSGQKIDITERQGDVLGFLHGEKPIQNCCQRLEELAREALGEHVTLRALPLYTTLKQEQQDEALKERKQPHDVLFGRIVGLLEQMVAGNKQHADVLAILNNAGQIHNLCDSLERRINSETITIQRAGKDVEVPNPIFPLKGTVSFYPWFTPETARQLYEGMPDRANFTIDPPVMGRIRVVISTNRQRGKLKASDFQHSLEEQPAERRVVVSTNVAETSLTIHGILHVVDSGLINQNKWDRPTQTSSVSPILQSRAGCKQRWGRAGRLQAGDAWLLYTEKQFGKEQGEDDANPDRCFVFYSLPEISRSPLDQVLLSAKKAGVASLDPERFPWLDVPDSAELRRASRSLTMKGALDPDGDLTEHGVELSNIRQDPRVGNMLVIADRFACAFEMTAVVAVATQGLKSLLVLDRNWDEATLREVRQRQTSVMSGCRDDLDASLKLMACWDEVSAAGAAFARSVDLLVQGDGFSQQLGNTAPAKDGHDPRTLLKTVRNSLVETEVNTAADELLGSIRDKNRRRELKSAIEHALSIRKNFQRLGAAWRSVVCNWAWPKVWEEGVLRPMLVKRLIAKPEKDEASEEVEAILTEFLERLRKSFGGGERALFRCCDEMAGRLGPRLKSRDDRAPEEVLFALAILSDANVLANPAILADRIGHFQGEAAKAIDEALLRLPEAAAKAWARANYLIPEAFAEAVAAKAELLQPLEGHKKGEESRPLDLSRNDRLRALFAHCLPDNCYLRTNDGTYRPIVPIAKANATESVRVEMSADSLCTAEPPGLFVCVERRAGPIIAGKDRRLFASFIVSLPESWASVISAGQSPLHQLGTIKLSKFIVENCPRNSTQHKSVLLDQIFPRGARCRVSVIDSAGDGLWRVSVVPPHQHPGQIVLRFKKASDEERAEPETEEEIRTPRRAPTDLALTSAQRTMKAGLAIEETTGIIDPKQWENLYQTRDGTTSAEIAAIRASSEVSTSEHTPLLQWQFESVEGVLSSGAELRPGSLMEAEVDQIINTPEGRSVPRLHHPSTEDQFEQFTKKVGLLDIGREFTMIVTRLERLLLDAGTVLVAREEQSGLEIPFGPRDLSFSTCRRVPELVAQHLPMGRSFTARLVQIDEESGRLRMTTHHMFHKLTSDLAAITGAQPCEVVQPTHDEPFVRVITKWAPEASGFVFIAKVSGEQLGDAVIGSQHTVHLSLPNRTRESWPHNAAVPAGLNDGDEPGQDSVLHRGVVAPGALTTWLAAVGNHRGARGAIYSLFERSHQLNGIDEAEYRKLEQCVGRKCTGRVTKNNDNGLELKLTEPSEVSAWMRAEEYSWYCDEQHQNVLVGQTLTVVGMEVDLTGPQVIISRRRLTPNPYTQYRLGQRVTCTVTEEDPMGAELRIDRLYGWIFADRFAALPQEGLLRSGQEPFDAIIVRVDSDQDGKITVSRMPIVQSLIRSMASATPLIGRVTTIQEKGVEILLAPDLKAWMPGEEVSWQRGRIELRSVFQENQEVIVVLLPQGENEDSVLRVSKKRVSSGQYIVSGSPGLFFAGKPTNLKTILEQFRASGMAAVNVDTINRGASGTQILIGADDAAVFNLLVRALSSMASANRCSLSPMGQGLRAPTRVENLLLPGVQKSTPPTSAKLAQAVPQRRAEETRVRERSDTGSDNESSESPTYSGSGGSSRTGTGYLVWIVIGIALLGAIVIGIALLGAFFANQRPENRPPPPPSQYTYTQVTPPPPKKIYSAARSGGQGTMFLQGDWPDGYAATKTIVVPDSGLSKIYEQIWVKDDLEIIMQPLWVIDFETIGDTLEIAVDEGNGFKSLNEITVEHDLIPRDQGAPWLLRRRIIRFHRTDTNSEKYGPLACGTHKMTMTEVTETRKPR